MTTPAEVLVFLHNQILDKEDELNTLEIQIQSNLKESRELGCLKQVAQRELLQLQGVVPVIKELNDHGRQDRDGHITTPSV
jgi:hypothetical protein